MRHEQIPVAGALTSILFCVNTTQYMGLYGRLWFLPCMFVTSILFRIIIKIKKQKGALIGIALVALILSWLTTRKISFRLPFTLDTSMMALFFMIMGFVLGVPIKYCLEKGHWQSDIIIALCCLFFLALSVRNGSQMWMYINQYGDYANTIMGAVAGVFAFIIIGKYMFYFISRLKICKNFVIWYGQNSLAVFPIHLQIKCIILLLGISFIDIVHWYNLFFVMLFGSVPIVCMLKRFVPVLSGDLKRIRK